jgi:nicotinate-nucleotide pyrophosphorylase (carboxylating)
VECQSDMRVFRAPRRRAAPGGLRDLRQNRPLDSMSSVTYHHGMYYEGLDSLIDLALREDLGPDGDVTSRAIFGNETVTTVLSSKARGVLAGMDAFAAVFRRVDRTVTVDPHRGDGEPLAPGDVVATVRGPTVSVLEAERTAINFLSYLTGIATETRRYVERAAEGGATVLDTRKTLPGYRSLAKYAVTVGGGKNHRIGLFDMVLIKDNHVDAVGGVQDAVERVRSAWGSRFRVEVECRNLGEVRAAADAGADVIMLDNMDVATCEQALTFRRPGLAFEVSGNVDLDTVAAYSRTGVDFVSVGRLTHSVRAFDFSMTVQNKKRG